MISNYENRISGDSPFKPEFERYINEHKGRGSLKVQVSAANRSFPVKNVFVDVAVIDGGRQDNVTYLISVYHPDFREIVDYPVTVQDRIETILPVALEPLSGVREG